ncbi:hypothetical protein DRH14_04650 [Candidatus Shapirobacteria bacterium]|nr:MAG: hypothetical protein DRH14_04650 [Candidatus Shapirobacteria bacterium]
MYESTSTNHKGVYGWAKIIDAITLGVYSDSKTVSLFTIYKNFQFENTTINTFNELYVRFGNPFTGERYPPSIPPLPSSIGASNNKPNEQCTFHAYWTVSGSHLDTATFYWNASGVMEQNGSIAFPSQTTEAWSNFTRVLPNQYGIVIAWYIIANDTYGNIGNTSVQYLQLGMHYELNLNFSVAPSFGFYCLSHFRLLSTFQPSVTFDLSQKADFNVWSELPVSSEFTVSPNWETAISLIFQPLISFGVIPAWNATVASIFNLPVGFSLDVSHGWLTDLILPINPVFTLNTQSAFHTVLSWSFPVTFSSAKTSAAYNVPLTFNIPLVMSVFANIGAITQYVNLQFPINVMLSLTTNSQFHNIFNLNIPVSLGTDTAWNATLPLSLNIPADFYIAAAKGAAYIVVLSWNIMVDLITGLTVTFGPPSIPITPTPIPSPTPQPQPISPTPQPTINLTALTGIIIIVAVIGATSIYGSLRRKPRMSFASKVFSSRKLKSLSLPKWLRRERKLIARKVEFMLKLPSWPKSSGKMPKWRKKKKRKEAKIKRKKIWD